MHSTSEPTLPPILHEKYPAKAHLEKVCKNLVPAEDPSTSQSKLPILYLEAAKSKLWPDCDQEAGYRANRSFYYVTGCDLPDCSMLDDVGSKKSTLFVPPVVAEEVMWSGMPLTVEEAGKLYDVDEVLTTNDLPDRLSSIKDRTIYALAQPSQPLPANTTLNTTALRPAISQARIQKDAHEIALIRHANAITALAHRAVLQRAPTASNEAQLAALFVERCAAHGAVNQAYSPIVASGTDAATLHYVRNNKATEGHLNLLLDAGGEYRCYASDVTCTFPLSGTFSKESKEIYNIVLDMQKQCMARVKAGMHWEDVHAHAHRVAIDALLKLGILHNGTANEIFNARTSCAFFPHGLGHYMGLDTHDTGGGADPATEKDKMLKYLRVRGKVPKDAVITVEPGVYFCRFIVGPYLRDEKHGRFIDREVLERYWAVGGVRIEDDVVVTGEGCENLTDVIREVEEIEALMAER